VGDVVEAKLERRKKGGREGGRRARREEATQAEGGRQGFHFKQVNK